MNTRVTKLRLITTWIFLLHKSRKTHLLPNKIVRMHDPLKAARAHLCFALSTYAATSSSKLSWLGPVSRTTTVGILSHSFIILRMNSFIRWLDYILFIWQFDLPDPCLSQSSCGTPERQPSSALFPHICRILKPGLLVWKTIDLVWDALIIHFNTHIYRRSRTRKCTGWPCQR